MPRSTLAGSYDRYTFNYLGNCETIFQRSSATDHSHEHSMEGQKALQVSAAPRVQYCEAGHTWSSAVH